MSDPNGSVAAALARRLPGDAGLALLAESRDAQCHDVAGLEVARRLLAHADAGRRAGRDDVARLQRDEAADIADEMGGAEDHRLGAAGLHALAVDVEPHVQRLRIAHFVPGHEPWPKRAEAVAALALVPGAAALDLEFALGDVVADEVAGDIVERLLLRHIARRA